MRQTLQLRQMWLFISTSRTKRFILEGSKSKRTEHGDIWNDTGNTWQDRRITKTYENILSLGFAVSLRFRFRWIIFEYLSLSLHVKPLCVLPVWLPTCGGFTSGSQLCQISVNLFGENDLKLLDFGCWSKSSWIQVRDQGDKSRWSTFHANDDCLGGKWKIKKATRFSCKDMAGSTYNTFPVAGPFLRHHLHEGSPSLVLQGSTIQAESQLKCIIKIPCTVKTTHQPIHWRLLLNSIVIATAIPSAVTTSTAIFSALVRSSTRRT